MILTALAFSISYADGLSLVNYLLSFVDPVLDEAGKPVRLKVDVGMRDLSLVRTVLWILKFLGLRRCSVDALRGLFNWVPTSLDQTAIVDARSFGSSWPTDHGRASDSMDQTNSFGEFQTYEASFQGAVRLTIAAVSVGLFLCAWQVSMNDAVMACFAGALRAVCARNGSEPVQVQCTFEAVET